LAPRQLGRRPANSAAETGIPFLSLSCHRMKMATVTPASGLAPVNGIELAYQIHGAGKPLVLLHGGFGSAEMFGPTMAALAAGRQVIGVDLQSHGRTPAVDRPMRFETMADDVAALIHYQGHEQADVMGFSLGGGVALRTAIQHPASVRRLVVVSTPFRRAGWHPEMVAGFDQMGPEFAEQMKRTPMFEAYQQIAPRVEDWPVLVGQLATLLKLDYDWTDEVAALPVPVLIVAGDADGLPPRHAVEFFELLGGGKRDAVWDRSGMTRHRLAILPGATHYDIDVAPALATVVARFLDEQRDET
jgi:pimeloyl-ACP methyl ester carboxylesterase